MAKKVKPNFNFLEMKYKSPNYLSEILNQNGGVCMMLKNYEKALECFHKSIACCCTNIAAWRNCIIAGKSLGWEDKLVSQYEDMVKHLERNTVDGALSVGFYPPPEIPEAVVNYMNMFWEGYNIT